LLKLPPLYAILDVEALAARGLAPMDVAHGWLDAGVRLIQLRAKTMASGNLLTLARDLAGLTHTAGGRLVLNDRADLARLGSDPSRRLVIGVHVGQTDLSPTDVRRLVGPDALVGLSTHTRDELRAAMTEPVDYVAVGAVFKTSTKGPDHPTVGLDFVRAAAALGHTHGKPIIAIGGIRVDTAASVIEAGASSVAVITDLLEGDPVVRAREYLAVLGL
jgi:thiamine-phosphate pyrophosphorylase